MLAPHSLACAKSSRACFLRWDRASLSRPPLHPPPSRRRPHPQRRSPVVSRLRLTPLWPPHVPATFRTPSSRKRRCENFFLTTVLVLLINKAYCPQMAKPIDLITASATPSCAETFYRTSTVSGTKPPAYYSTITVKWHTSSIIIVGRPSPSPRLAH
jgi:hypothetical protein